MQYLKSFISHKSGEFLTELELNLCASLDFDQSALAVIGRIWFNFDRVLELRSFLVSSFHEKKRPNFSFFRDFCKFNRLKIKCLTA